MKKSQSHLDNKFMKMALDKAYEHLGSTKENPSVGCIVVKNNAVISSGTTSLKISTMASSKGRFVRTLVGSFTESYARSFARRTQTTSRSARFPCSRGLRST